MKRPLFFLIIPVLMIVGILYFTLNGDLKTAQENRLQNNLKGAEKQNSTEADKGISNERDTINCNYDLTLAPLNVLAPTKQVLESMESWQREKMKYDECGKSLDELLAFEFLYRGRAGDINKSTTLKDKEKIMLKDKVGQAERCFREIRRICRNDKGIANAKRPNARKDAKGWCKYNCSRLKELYGLVKKENINSLQYTSSGSNTIGDFTMAQANGIVLIYPDHVIGGFSESPGFVEDADDYNVLYGAGRNVKLSNDVEINSKGISFFVCDKKLKKEDILNDIEIISLDFLDSKEDAIKLSEESLLANFVYYESGFKPEWGYKMEIVNDPGSSSRD